MPGAGARFVLVIVTGVNDYQARLLRGMRAVFAEHDIPILVHVNDPYVDRMPTFLPTLLRDERVCGVISSACTGQAQERILTELTRDLTVPRVYVGQEVPGATCVHADNEHGMRQLMGHVLDECGLSRPVLVRGAPHQADSIAREAVFRQELARRRIPLDEEFVINGRFERDITYASMQRLLIRRQDMDVVVALNDPSALGAVAALRDEGLRTPDDVAVTGFDNEVAASVTWPGLTTVDQDAETQGEIAASLLIEQMNGASPRASLVVPSQLVVRGSTAADGPPAGHGRAATAMAQAAQMQLAARDAVLSLNRALVRCRTLDELVSALSARLDSLGIDRCFLVLYEQHGTRNAMPERARVVMDHRYGHTQAPPGEVFSTRRLLPDTLSEELSAGVLVLQPLSLGEREIGYVLFELIRGPALVSEVMQVDLAYALEMTLTGHHDRGPAGREVPEAGANRTGCAERGRPNG